VSIEVIEGLNPKTLWRRFYEISQIPRPSKKEEKALKYLKETGRELNLEIKEDDFGNIVMLVPATPGCENTQPVVIQSHVDMVC
jgi:dipeptidase D